MSIGLNATDSHFKRHFSPIGTLSLAGRSVNLVKIRSSPAVFPGICASQRPIFPTPRACTSASRAVPSAPANTNPGLRIKPPEIVPRAAPAREVAAAPTTPGAPNSSAPARRAHGHNRPRAPSAQESARSPPAVWREARAPHESVSDDAGDKRAAGKGAKIRWSGTVPECRTVGRAATVPQEPCNPGCLSGVVDSRNMCCVRDGAGSVAGRECGHGGGESLRIKSSLKASRPFGTFDALPSCSF